MIKAFQRRVKSGLAQTLDVNSAETASILKNIGWLLQGKLINYILIFAVGIYTINRLGPERYGVFTYCYALSSFFTTLVGFGLREIVIRELAKNAENRRTILGTAGALMGGFSLVSYGLVIGVVYVLRPSDDFSHQLVSLLGVSLFFVPLTVFSFYFDAQLQSKKAVGAANIASIATSAAKVTVATVSKNLFLYGVATLTESFITGIGLLYLAIKEQLLNGLRFDRRFARMLLRDSWPLAVSNMAIWLFMRVDQILVRDMAGDFESGIYATANRFVDAVYFVPMIIQSSFLPKIVKAHQKSLAEFLQSLAHLHKIMVGAAYAIIVGFVLFIKPFIVFFLGNRFEASADVSLVLVITLLFVALGVARNAYVYTLNLSHLFLRITLIGSVLNIGMNMFLIPRYGAYGAAISVLVTQFYVTFLSSFIHKPLRPTGKIALKALLLQS
ncbi:flippase [Spirosoma agri]|uniref:Flippase n=1 Tax=Spirosoma agri TaxID=1987381 RepID=A0A6M0IQV8_9BACT|nr:flippase [Spirosoma agri]NEU69333.1 flippase [Spirosoma agri]